MMSLFLYISLIFIFYLFIFCQIMYRNGPFDPWQDFFRWVCLPVWPHFALRPQPVVFPPFSASTTVFCCFYTLVLLLLFYAFVPFFFLLSVYVTAILIKGAAIMLLIFFFLIYLFFFHKLNGMPQRLTFRCFFLFLFCLLCLVSLTCIHIIPTSLFFLLTAEEK